MMPLRRLLVVCVPVALVAGCMGAEEQSQAPPSASGVWLAALQADAKLDGAWEADAACAAIRQRGLEVVQCDGQGLTARGGGTFLSVRVMENHLLYSETFEEPEPRRFETQPEGLAAAEARWDDVKEEYEADLDAFARALGAQRQGPPEWRPVFATP